MKLFSAAQIKQWDAYTIANEPVSSLDLMERAATACFNWLQQQYPSKQTYYFFCGKGNNGGDGLALARLLGQQKHTVAVYILQTGKEGTADFNTNLKKLETVTFNINSVTSQNDFPEIPGDALVFDALFGTGLNKPPENSAAELINHINKSGNKIIAVDIPSGLFADASSKTNTVINAETTLTFQQPKLSFLLPENERYCGNVQVLDISLHKKFYEEENTAFNIIDAAFVKSIYKPRKKFTHKGSYGHAAIIAGSYGMMGAAMLSAKACLRSGVGKLTVLIPKCGYAIMQTAVPEAMCITQGENFIEDLNISTDKFSSVGIGPGMAKHPSHKDLLHTIFSSTQKPMVIDADALNVIADNDELLNVLPANSILTPHPKEFERLFGTTENDFERLQLALKKSAEHNVFIVLKGYNSFISTPQGKGFFNTTGNAGMATAGSGDALTGIITGLLAQNYPAEQACILGVYLHGLAGDVAAEKLSQEAMIARDIIDGLGDAFKIISTVS
jgi:ADP-dependent NAD(P)H-hydrate dehydratase / NAD(P)H-hydrate epimerase